MVEAVADDVDVPEGEEAAAPVKRRRFSGKVLVLFVALPLMLLMVAGLGAWKTGLIDRFTKPAPAAARPAVFLDLPEMLVNLNTNDGRASYLKLRVALELDGSGDVLKISKVMPRVIDAFETYLREMRMEDLNGSAGLYRLKEELLIRVNAAVAPIKVRNVLFKDMLVQ